MSKQVLIPMTKGNTTLGRLFAENGLLEKNPELFLDAQLDAFSLKAECESLESCRGLRKKRRTSKRKNYIKFVQLAKHLISENEKERIVFVEERRGHNYPHFIMTSGYVYAIEEEIK